MDFDDVATRYDAWFTSPLGRSIDRWEKALTWKLARPLAGERVLDIGTGTANYLLELARLGLECTGLDVNRSMLLRAAGKALRMGLNVRLVAAEGSALPFPDGHFDLVLSVTAFEFFPDPALAASEMMRVCRPGGRIVVGILNKWSTWSVRRRVISWFKETIFARCRFYSYPEMTKLFGTLDWGTSAFAPPGLPNRLIPFFDRIEPRLQRIAKPFGAYLVIRTRVPGSPENP
jgi:ubiquinone/menaquinone biosynthesis C-methylase UbiE